MAEPHFLAVAPGVAAAAAVTAAEEDAADVAVRYWRQAAVLVSHF